MTIRTFVIESKYISHTCRCFEHSIHQRILKISIRFPQIYGSSTTFSTLIKIRNVSWEMFSNSALHHRNKLRFKISSNRKQLFDIVIFFTILLFLLFWANKCSLGEQKRLLIKQRLHGILYMCDIYEHWDSDVMRDRWMKAFGMERITPSVYHLLHIIWRSLSDVWWFNNTFVQLNMLMM